MQINLDSNNNILSQGILSPGQIKYREHSTLIVLENVLISPLFKALSNGDFEEMRQILRKDPLDVNQGVSYLRNSYYYNDNNDPQLLKEKEVTVTPIDYLNLIWEHVYQYSQANKNQEFSIINDFSESLAYIHKLITEHPSYIKAERAFNFETQYKLRYILSPNDDLRRMLSFNDSIAIAFALEEMYGPKNDPASHDAALNCLNDDERKRFKTLKCGIDYADLNASQQAEIERWVDEDVHYTKNPYEDFASAFLAKLRSRTPYDS